MERDPQFPVGTSDDGESAFDRYDSAKCPDAALGVEINELSFRTRFHPSHVLRSFLVTLERDT